YSEKGYRNIILFPNEKQIDRLKAIFKENGHKAEFEPILKVLHEGFVDHDLKICCYTDHQIFERYHRFRMQENKPNRQAMTIKELNMLHPGDYVVHIDHGIGKFSGLVRMEVNGKMQEVIKLEFRDRDVIFVSIHSLHRISKYKGKDGTEPSISKLGSGAWQKLKNRTKAKVKDIARELILLYAKRKEEQGYTFSPDSYLQEELEASFIYEDTPDQMKATQAVKEDMQKAMPMDRLVCGDVGFGKTEVAIRAAFKAVTDSKQVAVLVPTTILALQHYKTFSERLSDFPVKVEYISRLRKSSDVTRIKKEIKEGKIDILIGTHRIVNKDLHFKDLGLLIVDEEQKFGVSVKDKLKQLKVNVDTLTLTATPIPRTLQFSLMGARDLSIINTPPPNRYPIQTEVYEFNEDIIREAINLELSRSGQVFVIHNRVQNIREVENLIRRLCPKAKTIVGHGQMDGEVLEKIMLDFINGEYDVLIATTIIESGLDIPNANTIIINNANSFGLSELHQLRGRVGRSNKKAFCYLLAPPLHELTQEARRRLKAIEEFSELGSGFNISMQDLDIRGAGNLLGAEQSGFIADIGFETYHRILNEAIQELKHDEFKELFADEQKDKAAQTFLKINYVSDCQIDTDLELLFPDSYITNISERMLLYRELDNMEDEEQLSTFYNNLLDRFGKLPQESLELLEVVKLRWLAISLGMEKIILKNKKMICHFISNQNSEFFKTKEFGQILNYVMLHPKICSMKEGHQKLTLTINNMRTINEARLLLDKMRTGIPE
ncbi:MAG: transcription-repair coupling factor, partial [Bacteroidota bacterium]|nr:transcription-repair coupling factor [Bacteroidota bacterium]